MSRHKMIWSLLIVVIWGPSLTAAEPSADQYLAFIRAQAAALRSDDRPPKTADEWQQRRSQLRARLEQAWGGFPDEPGPLTVRRLETLERDGYHVEKLLLQTMPDVWMPALAYVPKAAGRHPAILSVHGHWKGAKVEPTVQSRAIGAAKLGFFVLAVDAFGAGERGIGEALGEYHGDMVAATLLPLGRPLSGIQVYENMRCVDYLQTRPEVDPAKIGITGASGGGNQTMYAGAWDERLRAIVPVCSVGNYQAYLGPACCLCEVVPGALRFTEEDGILGLMAPRAAMPCNVTRDGIQFSIREARKSVVGAQEVYNLLGVPDQIYHTTFRWKHDYHQPIREAMYGWMSQHLKGEGDGSPIPEPAHQTEDPETLRLFPGDSRPDDWLTLPQFAARESRKLLEQRQSNSGTESARAAEVRRQLVKQVLGGFPTEVPLEIRPHGDAANARSRWRFVSEPGIDLELVVENGGMTTKRDRASDIVLLLHLDGEKAAQASQLAKRLDSRNVPVCALNLRATGELAPVRNRVGRAPDHQTAEWALWIGRPLLGQWVWDVRRAIQVLRSPELPFSDSVRIHLVGIGPAGLVALTAAAVDPTPASTAAIDSLASYISDVPYQNQYLGLMAPHMLRYVGDVREIAALSQSPRTIVAGGVHGGGDKLPFDELKKEFQGSSPILGDQNTTSTLTVIPSDDVGEIVSQILHPGH